MDKATLPNASGYNEGVISPYLWTGRTMKKTERKIQLLEQINDTLMQAVVAADQLESISDDDDIQSIVNIVRNSFNDVHKLTEELEFVKEKRAEEREQSERSGSRPRQREQRAQRIKSSRA
jgi:hypothetical protein